VEGGTTLPRPKPPTEIRGRRASTDHKFEEGDFRGFFSLCIKSDSIYFSRIVKTVYDIELRFECVFNRFLICRNIYSPEQ